VNAWQTSPVAPLTTESGVKTLVELLDEVERSA
jgi:hypothetical protein